MFLWIWMDRRVNKAIVICRLIGEIGNLAVNKFTPSFDL